LGMLGSKWGANQVTVWLYQIWLLGIVKQWHQRSIGSVTNLSRQGCGREVF
jgi:hypothetical protein